MLISKTLTQFFGPQIFESPHLQTRTQFRFPRSRKRRIRKKWAARENNYKYIPNIYYDAARNVIYAHPSIAQKMRDGAVSF